MEKEMKSPRCIILVALIFAAWPVLAQQQFTSTATCANGQSYTGTVTIDRARFFGSQSINATFTTGKWTCSDAIPGDLLIVHLSYTTPLSAAVGGDQPYPFQAPGTFLEIRLNNPDSTASFQLMVNNNA